MLRRTRLALSASTALVAASFAAGGALAASPPTVPPPPPTTPAIAPGGPGTTTPPAPAPSPAPAPTTPGAPDSSAPGTPATPATPAADRTLPAGFHWLVDVQNRILIGVHDTWTDQVLADPDTSNTQPYLEVAPDRPAYVNSWDAPGLTLAVFPNDTPHAAAATNIDQSADCITHGQPLPLTARPELTGTHITSTGCGPSGQGSVDIIAAPSVDQQYLLVLLVQQGPNADPSITQTAIASFGTLAPGEAPPTNPPATAPGQTTPGTQPPAPPTVPPATQPPATQPPATQPPATQPPATQPPATQPPATQPPATQPPATGAPAPAGPIAPSMGDFVTNWNAATQQLASTPGLNVEAFQIGLADFNEAPLDDGRTAFVAIFGRSGGALGGLRDAQGQVTNLLIFGPVDSTGVRSAYLTAAILTGETVDTIAPLDATFGQWAVPTAPADEGPTHAPSTKASFVFAWSAPSASGNSPFLFISVNPLLPDDATAVITHTQVLLEVVGALPDS